MVQNIGDNCCFPFLLNRVFFKFLSSRSFVKSGQLWVQRTHTMGSRGMLSCKIFENWNAGKHISWHVRPSVNITVKVFWIIVQSSCCSFSFIFKRYLIWASFILISSTCTPTSAIFRCLDTEPRWSVDAPFLGKLCLFFCFNQSFTESRTGSLHWSECSGGPLIETCISACSMSFWSLDRSLVFMHWRALAPRSGYAFEVGIERQHPARLLNRG